MVNAQNTRNLQMEQVWFLCWECYNSINDQIEFKETAAIPLGDTKHISQILNFSSSWLVFSANLRCFCTFRVCLSHASSRLEAPSISPEAITFAWFCTSRLVKLDTQPWSLVSNSWIDSPCSRRPGRFFSSNIFSASLIFSSIAASILDISSSNCIWAWAIAGSGTSSSFSFWSVPPS